MRKDQELILKDSDERVAELQDLYIIERNKFLHDFDDMALEDRMKVIRQLRGILDDIAKESGGRIKRQESINTFGTADSSFMELIAGVRGNLPEPKPIVDVVPLTAKEVFGEEATVEGTREEL